MEVFVREESLVQLLGSGEGFLIFRSSAFELPRFTVRSSIPRKYLNRGDIEWFKIRQSQTHTWRGDLVVCVFPEMKIFILKDPPCLINISYWQCCQINMMKITSNCQLPTSTTTSHMAYVTETWMAEHHAGSKISLHYVLWFIRKIQEVILCFEKHLSVQLYFLDKHGSSSRDLDYLHVLHWTAEYV